MTATRQASVVRLALRYFLLVFLAGFVLGPVRVLLVEPAVGRRAAVLFEIPLMIAVILYTAHRMVRGPAAHCSGGQCIAWGGLAAGMVIAADWVVGLLRGMPFREILTHGDGVAATAYYSSVLIVGLAPLVWRWRRFGREPEL